MSKRVNAKTHARVATQTPMTLPGQKMAAYRKRLGLTQVEFAESLRTNQKTLSRWEKAEKPLPVEALLLMAEMVPEMEKAYWQQQAGVRSTPISPHDPRTIPVLHDSAAAGTGRAIDENEVEYWITMPAHTLPPGGKLYGVRVTGDSMSPILEDGDVVIVDVLRRNAAELSGHMIAAREGDEVTIKWLRQHGDGYLLMPENLVDHAIRRMTSDRDSGIAGEVVKSICEPRSPRK